MLTSSARAACSQPIPALDQRPSAPWHSILVILLLAISIVMPAGSALAQSLSKEEARAAAALEILKEEKDRQERAQIDRMKNELQNSRSSEHREPLIGDAGFYFLLTTFLVVGFWLAAGKHILKIVQMHQLKGRLQRMTPEERRKFFEANPDL